MGRFSATIAVLALAVGACGSSASPASSTAPVTSAPAAAQSPATVAPTATPVAIAAAATFDGTTCTYTGPAVFPRGSVVRFGLTNTPAALKGSRGAALYVVPVVDGTTWQEIVAYTPGHKVSDIPPWANLPGVGVAEAQILYPEAANAGDTMDVVMTRNLYDVMCATAPEEGETGYPAILLKVLAS